VAPVGAVAVAETVTAEPTVTIAPLDGAVTVAVGDRPAATVTFTTEEVIAAPLESVTRAVNATLPAAFGTQLTV
jgi:hypothetical protein